MCGYSSNLILLSSILHSLSKLNWERSGRHVRVKQINCDTASKAVTSKGAEMCYDSNFCGCPKRCVSPNAPVFPPTLGFGYFSASLPVNVLTQVQGTALIPADVLYLSRWAVLVVDEEIPKWTGTETKIVCLERRVFKANGGEMLDIRKEGLLRSFNLYHGLQAEIVLHGGDPV